VPLTLVSPQGDPPAPSILDPVSERGQVLLTAARDLTEYNESPISDADFGAHVQTLRAALGLPSAADDAFGQARERLADWILPFMARADLLATRLQHWFRLLSAATFVMAAAAVAVVAIQISYLPAQDWVVGLEVLLLLTLLGIPLLRKKLRLHDRWTSYRFLAERLRSAYFLALAGTGDRARQPGPSASFTDPSVGWIERALGEISARRPTAGGAPAEVGPLRDYLDRYWIGHQMTYHDGAHLRNERRENWLRRFTAILFGITLVSAVLHAAGLGPSLHLTAGLVVLSIAVPAVGAAVHGIGTEREYRRHAARCQRMVAQLTQLHRQMAAARNLPEIRQVAANVERSMREESNDWFGVMRFHDIELIM
jgi:hypothetical protein